MSSLEERMNLLKEKHDTRVTSDDKTPTPLAALLHIYNSAHHDCYIDHMKGAKLIIKYLSPIEMPESPPTTLPLPTILVHYELTELARLLIPNICIPKDLLLWRRWELAIIQESVTLAQEIQEI